MPHYKAKLAKEALVVGGGNIVAVSIARKMLPKAHPIVQIFLGGVMFHLAAEYSGLNNIYLQNAAALENEPQHTDWEAAKNAYNKETKCSMALSEPSSCWL